MPAVMGHELTSPASYFITRLLTRIKSISKPMNEHEEIWTDSIPVQTPKLLETNTARSSSLLG